MLLKAGFELPDREKGVMRKNNVAVSKVGLLMHLHFL